MKNIAVLGKVNMEDLTLVLVGLAEKDTSVACDEIVLLSEGMLKIFGSMYNNIPNINNKNLPTFTVDDIKNSDCPVYCLSPDGSKQDLRAVFVSDSADEDDDDDWSIEASEDTVADADDYDPFADDDEDEDEYEEQDAITDSGEAEDFIDADDDDDEDPSMATGYFDTEASEITSDDSEEDEDEIYDDGDDDTEDYEEDDGAVYFDEEDEDDEDFVEEDEIYDEDDDDDFYDDEDMELKTGSRKSIVEDEGIVLPKDYDSRLYKALSEIDADKIDDKDLTSLIHESLGVKTKIEALERKKIPGVAAGQDPKTIPSILSPRLRRMEKEAEAVATAASRVLDLKAQGKTYAKSYKEDKVFNLVDPFVKEVGKKPNGDPIYEAIPHSHIFNRLRPYDNSKVRASRKTPQSILNLGIDEEEDKDVDIYQYLDDDEIEAHRTYIFSYSALVASLSQQSGQNVIKISPKKMAQLPANVKGKTSWIYAGLIDLGYLGTRKCPYCGSSMNIAAVSTCCNAPIIRNAGKDDKGNVIEKQSYYGKCSCCNANISLKSNQIHAVAYCNSTFRAPNGDEIPCGTLLDPSTHYDVFFKPVRFLHLLWDVNANVSINSLGMGYYSQKICDSIESYAEQGTILKVSKSSAAGMLNLSKEGFALICRVEDMVLADSTTWGDYYNDRNAILENIKNGLGTRVVPYDFSFLHSVLDILNYDTNYNMYQFAGGLDFNLILANCLNKASSVSADNLILRAVQTILELNRTKGMVPPYSAIKYARNYLLGWDILEDFGNQSKSKYEVIGDNGQSETIGLQYLDCLPFAGISKVQKLIYLNKEHRLDPSVDVKYEFEQAINKMLLAVGCLSGYSDYIQYISNAFYKVFKVYLNTPDQSKVPQFTSDMKAINNSNPFINIVLYKMREGLMGGYSLKNCNANYGGMKQGIKPQFFTAYSYGELFLCAVMGKRRKNPISSELFYRSALKASEQKQFDYSLLDLHFEALQNMDITDFRLAVRLMLALEMIRSMKNKSLAHMILTECELVDFISTGTWRNLSRINRYVTASDTEYTPFTIDNVKGERYYEYPYISSAWDVLYPRVMKLADILLPKYIYDENNNPIDVDSSHCLGYMLLATAMEKDNELDFDGSPSLKDLLPNTYKEWFDCIETGIANYEYPDPNVRHNMHEEFGNLKNSILLNTGEKHFMLNDYGRTVRHERMEDIRKNLLDDTMTIDKVDNDNIIPAPIYLAGQIPEIKDIYRAHLEKTKELVKQRAEVVKELKAEQAAKEQAEREAKLAAAQAEEEARKAEEERLKAEEEARKAEEAKKKAEEAEKKKKEYLESKAAYEEEIKQFIKGMTPSGKFKNGNDAYTLDDINKAYGIDDAFWKWACDEEKNSYAMSIKRFGQASLPQLRAIVVKEKLLEKWDEKKKNTQPTAP